MRRVFVPCIALALLSGCGGTRAQFAPPAPAPLQAASDPAQSWTSPDATSRYRLLYVTDPSDNIVYVLSLPTGKLVGRLSGFDQPLGDCVDKKGDVFVTDSQTHVVREFKHGAKVPVNVLDDHDYYPIGCAVDPVTGNLAVTNCCSTHNGPAPGDVAIYVHAKGQPKKYRDANVRQYGFCAYDDRGDLFISGIKPPTDAPQIAELPHGEKNFKTISLNQDLGGNNVSALQWDGTYLTVASQSAAIIYRFRIAGSHGVEVSAVQLDRAAGVLGYWLDGSTLYAPVYSKDSIGSVNAYPYPSGGKASKIYYGAANPWAVTISVRPSSR